MEIEELKLLKVQQHIDLSLKLVRPSELPTVQKIKEATYGRLRMINGRMEGNRVPGNEAVNAVETTVQNRALPRRQNQAEANLEAARVRRISKSLICMRLQPLIFFVIFFPQRVWGSIFQQSRIIPSQILRPSLSDTKIFNKYWNLSHSQIKSNVKKTHVYAQIKFQKYLFLRLFCLFLINVKSNASFSSRFLIPNNMYVCSSNF